MNEECVLVGERDAVAEAQEAIRNAKICFRPLGDRIIVEPIDVDKTFIPGGLLFGLRRQTIVLRAGWLWLLGRERKPDY